MIVGALDLEANGLIETITDDPNFQPAIIEIGVAHCNDPAFMDHFSGYAKSWFVNPEQPIKPDVVEITKITDDMVADARTFPVLFGEFYQTMRAIDVLVTFNGAAYDFPVLMYNLRKYNLQYNFCWPRRNVDLMLVATDYMNLGGKTGNKPPKLSELYQHLFNEEIVDAHRAANDAMATLRCGVELFKRGLITL